MYAERKEVSQSLLDVFIVLFLTAALVVGEADAAGSSVICRYTAGDIVGIVIGSVVITLTVVGISLVSLWYLWKNNRLKLAFLLQKNAKTKSEQRSDVQKASDVEAGHEYAFDNPYFKDDDNEISTNGKLKCKGSQNEDTRDSATVIANRGSVLKDSNHVTEATNNNMRNGYGKESSDKKRLIKSLPLSSVLNHVCKQKQQMNQKGIAMDDTCIKPEPEQVTVELTGHDFTGLGFNICGNMRDGIFVKDVMTRGPANESGKVKTGDRIVSLTISFSQMVYEDALTILSYASPYKVELTVQKSETKEITPSSGCINRRVCLTNSSHGSGRRLLHPLYRSQSVEDLTQIGKASSLSEKSTSSGGTVSVMQKIKSQILNKSTKSTSSDKDRSGSPSDKKTTNLLVPGSPKCHDSKPGTPTKELSGRQTPEVTPVLRTPDIELKSQRASKPEPVRENSEVVLKLEEEPVAEVLSKEKEDDPEQQAKLRPQPAPRKPASSGKRKGKAPQPPGSLDATDHSGQNSSELTESPLKLQLETTVQVHQVDETGSNRSDENVILTGIKNEIENENENESKSSTVSSSSHVEVPPVTKDKLLFIKNKDLGLRCPGYKQARTRSGEKLKSCSLGDLTRVCTQNGRSTPNILERAVSLDLKEHQFPEENLCHHYKNLQDSSSDYNHIESMPLTKWGAKDTTVASVLTTSSSDCTGSSVKLSVNGVGPVNDHANYFPNIINTNSIDNFTTSTPMKGLALSEITVQINDTSEETSTCKDEQLNGELTMESTKSESEPIESVDLLVSSAEPEKEDEPKVAEELTNGATISISKGELDTMMMSHQGYMEYLNKQALKRQRINEPFGNLKMNTTVSSASQLDFESWSYISDNDASLISTNESQEPSHYKTALEVNQLSSSYSGDKHTPEVSGVTFKTP